MGIDYLYKELPLVHDQRMGTYINDTRRLSGQITAVFDDAKNTEWFVRSYLALKFILGATVFATSAIYAEKSNLKVVIPYLNYYMMLSACRAFILTLPCLPWRGDRSIEMTHNSIINTSTDKLKRIGSSEAENFGKILRAAKDQRDLFSYRFPSSGLAIFGQDLITVDRAVSTARFFTELAQLNSACLEAAAKEGKGSYELLEVDDVWHLMKYETETGELVDDEDYNRVAYFHRKYRGPRALVSMATEGLVEDFFGAWSDELESGGYDGSINYNLLLDVF